jgi:hypothetical protein
LKEEVLDRTLWITEYGKDYGPFVRQASEGMNTYFAKLLQIRALCSAEYGNIIQTQKQPAVWE